MLIYGVGLLAFSVFLPEGIAGGAATLWRRYLVQRRSGERSAAPEHLSAHTIEPTEGARLSIDAVSKNFGGVKALSDVSVTVEPGQLHAIVGPNGSGKTTLLNLISGLYNASSGSIRLDETELVGQRPRQIARMGVRRTFQTPKLLRGLTVLENVRFGAASSEAASGVELTLTLPRARREAADLDAKAIELLTLVGLAYRAGDRAEDLPHGQQRLIEIARALIGRPRLLLLDEPAAGLSLGELERLGELLQEVRRLGVTLVMVEHHIELVADIAQSVTVLDQGRVLVSGGPAEVFGHPEVIKAYTGARA
jgi:ABC-type branched-subunit amino acid transport system ATPase component